MNPCPTKILLDTGVVFQALRDNALWKRIEAEHQLLSRKDRPILPIICVGELLAIGRMNGWGIHRITSLESILTNLIIADIRSRQVIEKYAEIKAFVRGKEIGQNDIWIAAIASVAGAHVLTCDTDFQRLEEGQFLTQTYYDPRDRVA